MMNNNSDEDRYADESFEADSDAISECGSKSDLTSEPEKPYQQQEQQRIPFIKNNALLASTRVRQMKVHGIVSAYPMNRDTLPFDSSSDDEDDVIYSEAFAEVNTKAMISDGFTSPNSPSSLSRLTSTESVGIKSLEQVMEARENEYDFSLRFSSMSLPQEEHNFVSDVSEELEMDMEMQVTASQAKMIEPNTYTDEFADGSSTESHKSAVALHELNDQIQHELHITKYNKDAVNDKQVIKKDSKQIYQSRLKPPIKVASSDMRKFHLNNKDSSIDMTELKGSKSYTIIPKSINLRNKNSLQQQQHNYIKEESPELEDNIDSPRSQKSSSHSSKMQDLTTTTQVETAAETDVDMRFREPTVQMRVLNNKSPASYRSELSISNSKPSQTSTLKFTNATKKGQSNRKSWSFSNERMRQIERENRILLSKILTQKPTIPTTKKKTTKV